MTYVPNKTKKTRIHLVCTTKKRMPIKTFKTKQTYKSNTYKVLAGKGMLARLVGALHMLAAVKALEAIRADAPDRVRVLDAAGAVPAHAPLAQLRTFACGAWSGLRASGSKRQI